MRDYAIHQSIQFETLPGGGVLLGLWRNWKVRRAVAAMEGLDDHLLRDIGVTRAQVEAAADSPLSENAAFVLQGFARANRGEVSRAASSARAEHAQVSPVRVS